MTMTGWCEGCREYLDELGSCDGCRVTMCGDCTRRHACESREDEAAETA